MGLANAQKHFDKARNKYSKLMDANRECMERFHYVRFLISKTCGIEFQEAVEITLPPNSL